VTGGTPKQAPRYYGIVRDFLKAARAVFGDAWGKDSYMVTKPVTLKALIRVCADLAREDGEREEGRLARWEQRLAPWGEQVREFREEGFYERFAAKGEVERVTRIHKDLARLAKIEIRGKA
jgi:tellurite resistance protein